MKQWNHAIISGGGSGLGNGLATRLLRRGSKVSVLDLAVRPEQIKLLDQAAREGNGSWELFTTDITDAGRVRASVEQAVQQFGTPDLAINSAGTGNSEAFADLSPETFARVVNINLNGSFHFAKAVLPHMRPGARLALIASMAGITSNYGYAAYGASKFGVVGLATTLRYEYEPLGIHISCICPPEVKTPMVEEEHANGNPISLEVKQAAGSLDADDACDQMIAGLDAGQWQIIPGFSAKVTAFATRHLPGPAYAVTNQLIRRSMRKHGLPVAR